ncbi:uncharacterized protein LOC116436761 isoform X2 [Corvus moneduloides]|uniref:uncharacterized protein LOC116436761 isoform X2 n=1 Tax=Corvus moneduloides TaxID=1196302 RepID=UPI0013627560|nr:uncharacterized protein LOC116436761 isoform X2 [Corvus moneduloides]
MGLSLGDLRIKSGDLGLQVWYLVQIWGSRCGAWCRFGVPGVDLGLPVWLQEGSEMGLNLGDLRIKGVDLRFQVWHPVQISGPRCGTRCRFGVPGVGPGADLGSPDVAPGADLGLQVWHQVQIWGPGVAPSADLGFQVWDLVHIWGPDVAPGADLGLQMWHQVQIWGSRCGTRCRFGVPGVAPGADLGSWCGTQCRFGVPGVGPGAYLGSRCGTRCRFGVLVWHQVQIWGSRCGTRCRFGVPGVGPGADLGLQMWHQVQIWGSRCGTRCRFGAPGVAPGCSRGCWSSLCPLPSSSSAQTQPVGFTVRAFSIKITDLGFQMQHLLQECSEMGLNLGDLRLKGADLEAPVWYLAETGDLGAPFVPSLIHPPPAQPQSRWSSPAGV